MEHLSKEKHTHILDDGTVVEHSHEHTHAHTHQNTKAVLNRISRAIGHLESIKRMVESGRAVSYTHLDVYKRQELQKRHKKMPELRFRAFLENR